MLATATDRAASGSILSGIDGRPRHAMVAVTAIFLVGWLGAVTNSIGTGYELQVIASTVIGGASLTGGFGSALGAGIGAILVETIRNALLLAGVNPFWQGTFVGCFILAAVLLERIRSVRR